MEKLEVTVIPEDFAKAPYGYAAGTGDQGCVLQQALRRIYPDQQYIHVGHDRVCIGALLEQRMYSINIDKWGSVIAEFSADRINELSWRAKKSLEGIPTVSLTLEQF